MGFKDYLDNGLIILRIADQSIYGKSSNSLSGLMSGKNLSSDNGPEPIIIKSTSKANVIADNQSSELTHEWKIFTKNTAPNTIGN